MSLKSRNVCILDYGSGNAKSVFNMLKILEPSTKISNKHDDLANATHLVLPGVGAFAAAMNHIQDKLPLAFIEQLIFDDKKPFLGICVGMQVMADRGHEFGQSPGLGWISGEVCKLNSTGVTLPHVGWNSIVEVSAGPLMNNFDGDIDFYFLHSYAFYPKDEEHVVAETKYGETFPAIIAKDNIYGVQFHPEKSQRAGRHLMENFLKLS